MKRQDVNTEEEANEYIAEELQPDQNVIDKDMMQDVDKNEGDDRDTKNDPRSIKVLMIDHTNVKMLDDELLQTRSKKSSRVVTSIVIGKTNCEESDRGEIRFIHPSEAILIMNGDGQKHSRN